MLEQITFLLALAGYAGLAATAVAAARGQFPVRFWRAVAMVILLHVVLVWAVRYEWRLAIAVRNGYVGFVLFHAALGMILASVFTDGRLARVLVYAAFAIVSLGAVGAVFRYDVVAHYRAPVLLIAVGGVVGVTRAYLRQRPRHTAA